MGSDNIPTYVHEGCKATFVVSLCYLFDISLQPGIYPRQWKLFPIPKTSDKFSFDNHRPFAFQLYSHTMPFAMILALPKILPLPPDQQS